MPHLFTMRKGWESEHLAHYLLSQISFISNPSIIGDDIGSDFICTLFEINKKKNKDFLIPKNSFAIQIKSNSRTINLTDKISYLANLEIPFFVGVVNKANLSLDVYSGEYFPQFISLNTPNELFIKYTQKRTEKYFDKLNNRIFNIYFPKILTLKPNLTRIQINETNHILMPLCAVIHENISTRRNKEYIFTHIEPKLISIIAGKDSAETFRYRFLLRLAECFRNLEWLFDLKSSDFSSKEFLIYEQTYLSLKELDISIPPFVDTIYRRIKEKLQLQ